MLKNGIKMTLLALGLCLAGCATTAPPELVSARASYHRASQGDAARLAPAEVHSAYETLALAERSYADDGASTRTRDLAYIADRNARLAESVGATRAQIARREQANRAYLDEQTQIASRATRDLAESQATLGKARVELGATRSQLDDSELARADATKTAEAERNARVAAELKTAETEQKLKDSELKLRALAAVTDEARGMVITLSGSVLFPSGQATLLPEAQTRLGQVADALLATKEHRIVIEGHTDSRGTVAMNLDLSQRRAEAVRQYLVSRGYDGDLIEAHGIGSDRPVANNGSAEGRANNRRVEIIVQK